MRALSNDLAIVRAMWKVAIALATAALLAGAGVVVQVPPALRRLDKLESTGERIERKLNLLLIERGIHGQEDEQEHDEQ